MEIEEGSTVSKTLKRDMLADGDLPALNGFVYEKIEGLAVTSSGRVWFNNDNDGVDDNAGEQYLFDLGESFIEVSVDTADCSTDGGDEPVDDPTDEPVEEPEPEDGAVSLLGAGAWFVLVSFALAVGAF